LSFLGFLTYIYLLRFPLLAWAAIVGIPVWACYGGKRMLAGAFDQTQWYEIGSLGLMSVIAASAVFITGRLILDYSKSRGSAPFRPRQKRWRRIWFLLSVGSIVPNLVVAFVYSYDGVSPGWFWLFIAAGLLTGGVLIAIVYYVLASAVPWLQLPIQNRFVVWMTSFVRPVMPKNFAPDALTPGDLNVLRLPTFLTDGYVITRNGVPQLRAGHAVATLLVVVFLGVYLGIGANHAGTPIVYVIILLTTLCFVLSGLAFFLDRYRIPVLLCLGLWLFAGAQCSWSDHYYYIPKRGTTYWGEQPAEYVLAERAGAKGTPIIVVSANGGGIQSAAWTAQVLAGLAQQFQGRGEQEQRGDADLRKFLCSIRLISGVSGGSVGTMFFANALEPPGRVMNFDHVVEEAENSSLSEVVWGLAYPDLAHALFPFARTDLILDRGHTLEEAWIKTAGTKGTNGSIKEGLLEWNKSVQEGWRPAIIFNSTIAESGERLQISTTPSWVKDQKGDPPPGRQEFFYLYDRDIRVATAARLSATYPYVSPAARPLYSGKSPVWPDKIPGYEHVHAVDGGYFDNSGLCALTEWLDQALEQRDHAHPRDPASHEKILVLQIRGFPEGEKTTFKLNRGWFYQLYAPVATLLGVWTSGQANTTTTELDLLKAKWSCRGIDVDSIIFEPDPSVYRGPDGKTVDIPLSWHLRAVDKWRVQKAWDNELTKKDNCKRVLDFVGPPLPGS
jgi:hypothetical protein